MSDDQARPNRPVADEKPFGEISRRDVLRSGLLAVGGAAFSAASGTLLPSRALADEPTAAVRELIGRDDPKTGWIDAHVHVWTPDVKRYPLLAGRRTDEMKPASFTPEQLFEHARPCGVSRVVLIQMSFYGFDNSYMLDTIERYPGVFAGVAVIDEQASEPAAEMRRLAKRGVRGFRIHPGQR